MQRVNCYAYRNLAKIKEEEQWITRHYIIKLTLSGQTSDKLPGEVPDRSLDGKELELKAPTEKPGLRETRPIGKRIGS